jgi:hypothetical protein
MENSLSLIGRLFDHYDRRLAHLKELLTSVHSFPLIEMQYLEGEVSGILYTLSGQGVENTDFWSQPLEFAFSESREKLLRYIDYCQKDLVRRRNVLVE